MHSGDGDEDLGGERTRGPQGSRQAAKAGQRQARSSPARAKELGKALRTVYDSTLQEEVPDDFLSLLGKLR